MTNDQLGKALVSSGLLPVGEVKSLWAAIPAEQRPKDGKSFADLLIAQGKLTKFQATELLSGTNTPLILGDYQLLAKIGAGGMGQVFKAQHRHMKRTVAIKLLPAELTKDEAAIKRFQREVEAAAKLSHPNIVQAFDASTQRGVWYLVMEYVEGRDLAGIVAAEGSLQIPRAVNYIRQSARGLGFAHESGVVHRDIKPANLLLDKKGTIKILDMGLARFDDGAAQEGLTQSGQVMGTVDYMAPEQAFDTRHADARADVYSLGCTLFRLLTAQNMYEGESLVQKLMGHQSKPIPKLTKFRPDVSPKLEAIFERMVAKDPKERYQTMAEVIAALAPFEEGGKADDGGGLTAHFEGIGAGPATNAALLAQPTSAQVAVGEVMPTISLNNPLQSTDPVSSRTIQTLRKNKPPLASGGKKKPPIWKQPMVLAAGGGGGLLIALLTIWVIFKDKDGNEVARVAVPEGGNAIIQEQPNKDQPPAKISANTNVPSTAVTNSQTALRFDANTLVTIPTLKPELTGPLTIEASITRDPASGNNAHFVGWLDGLRLCTNSTDHAACRWTEKTNDSSHITLARMQNQKYQLALVYNGQEILGFLDGKLIKTVAATGFDPKQIRKAFTLGGFNSGNQQSLGFVGQLHGVRVSKSARYSANYLPEERYTADKDTVAIYNFDEGTGDVLKDSSGNNHHGKIVGAKWVPVTISAAVPRVPARDYGLRFAGQNQYTQLPQGSNGLLALREPWTIESWLTVDPRGLIEKGPGYLIFHDKEFNLTPKLTADQVLRWSMQAGMNNLTYSKDAILPHQPQHVAITYDKSKVRLFVSGKLQAELPAQFSKATTTFYPGPSAWSTTNDRIGFHGTLAEVRLSNIVRYQGAFEPPTRMSMDEATLALYHMDEGEGKVARDSSSRANNLELVGATWVKSGDSDLQRAAIEWLLALKAQVSVGPNGSIEQITSYADYLTKNKPVSVVALNNPAVTDQDLAKLLLFPEIYSVNLASAPISDAGLSYLAKMPKLTSLALNGTKVTDRGLQSLVNCRKLDVLHVGGNPLTAECLKTVGQLPEMYSLSLQGLRVTDESLVELEKLQNLSELNISECKQLTDACCGTLARLPRLASLGADVTELGDQGIAKLAESKTLSRLNLYGTKLTDGAMPHLSRIKTLKNLDVRKTALTAAGVKQLAAALPQCEIQSDHGNFKPTQAGSNSTASPAKQTSLSFDGVDDLVELPMFPLDPAGPLTIEAWFTVKSGDKPNANDVDAKTDAIWSLQNPRTKTLANFILDHANGGWWFGAGTERQQRTVYYSFTKNNPRTDLYGVRHHAAFVRDGDEVKIFVDGVPLRSGGTIVDFDKTPPNPPIRFNEVEKFFLGAAASLKDGKSLTRFFHGSIDEFRLSNSVRYTQPFTPTPVFEKDPDTVALYHFDEGTGDVLKDSSGNNHHGKIVGAEWVKADGAATTPAAPVAGPSGGYALRTPQPGALAAGQGVTIPTLKLPERGPYTVETYFTPLDKEYGRLYWIAYQLNLELDSQSKLNIFAKGRTASGKDHYSPRGTTTFPLAPGKTYHLAAVRTKDESQFQLYVDGKLAASCEAIIFGADPFVFGMIAGDFDEFRVSKVARYEKDFTPATRFEPDADTLALYHLDEGTGDVINDASGNNHHGKIVGAKWVSVGPTSSTNAPRAAEWSLVETQSFKNSKFDLVAGLSSISHDGLGLVTVIGTSDRDVALSTRENSTAEWPAPQNLGPQVNSKGGLQEAEDAYPALSQDQRTLVFFSKREQSEALWMAQRNKPTDPFENAVKLGPDINQKPVRSIYPSLSANGLWLTFARTPSINSSIGYIARRGDFTENFAHVQPLGPAIDALGYLNGIAVSDDGLTIVCVVRTNATADAPAALWTASRRAKDEPFTNPQPLAANLNNPRDRLSPTLSGDAKTLWVVRNKEILRAVRNSASSSSAANPGPPPAIAPFDAAAPPPVVYLDDLPEVEWKTITDKPLGKHGKYFDQGATKETAIIFRGKPVTHSLWMHPPFSGDRTGFARYQLDGRYTTFAAEAGVTENSTIDPQSPLTFRVLGDGRELWKSPPLQKRGASAEVSLDVSGVKELRLEAACGDKNGNCHAMWFMPRLTPVSLAATAVASPIGPTPPLATAPFDAAQAKVHQEAWAKHLGLPVEFTNGIGMKFRLIPPGEFMMGLDPKYTDEELQRIIAPPKGIDPNLAHFRPSRPVRITRPFYMQVEEVTVGRYREIVGQLRPEMAQNPNIPLPNCVAWPDAIAFCNKLSEREGKRPAYKIEGATITPIDDTDGYRLPTEAEWEYACRAGTDTLWYFGHDINGKNYMEKFAMPNPFGLDAMYGGVSEWCWDANSGPQVSAALRAVRDDPRQDTGNFRVQRGGSQYAGGGSDRNVINSFSRRLYDGGPFDFAKHNYCGLGRVVLPIQLQPQVVAPQSAAPPVPAVATGMPGGVGLILFIGDVGAEAPAPALDTQQPWTAEVYITPLTENLANNTCGIIESAQGFGFRVKDGKYLAYSFHGETLGGNVKSGERVHLACVQTATKRILFVNGKLVGSTDNPILTEKKPFGKILFTLVNNIPNQPPIDVLVQGLRISQSVRYTTDFTPPGRHTPDKDTLALYHLDEGQGTTLTDSSGNNLHGKIINAKWGKAPAVGSTSGKLFMHDPAFPQWVKDVQTMPADKQIEAVSKKLVELNPGFDGVLLGRDKKGAPTIQDSVVKILNFDPRFVTDLSPLRGFAGLVDLNCGGTGTRGRVQDLSPLAGLPLTSISVYVTGVKDLTPLQGMSITYMNCGDIPITDLKPLKDMPIRNLYIPATKISDLSPLAGRPLQLLNCEKTPVTDLSPLEKCRDLTSLNVKGTKVTAAGIAALQKALPNCKIEWDEPAATPPK